MKYLTTTQIATRLGIHPSRVRRLADQLGVGTKVENANLRLYTEADAAKIANRSTGLRGVRKKP